jgi:hypothetical protein
MGRTAMTDKTIDLDHSSRNGGSEIHGSPSTVGVVPASKKALQLRQDELKTQMVAAQNDMAKGQLRSNREKKKPKADKNKSKTSIPASPWASTQFQAKSTRPSTGKNSHEG